MGFELRILVGGSWVRLFNEVTTVIAHSRGLITSVVATHEPPSIHESASSGT